MLQQPDRREIARARAHAYVFGRNRLQIVIEDIRTGGDDDFSHPGFAQEIRRQDLNRSLGAARANGANDCGKMRRSAIVEIVAIDGSDDNVGKLEFFRGCGNVFGFMRIERTG